MIFAYSDLHLYHTNIGSYYNRPEDFSERIIKRHNEVVHDDDTVLNLGDLGFQSATAKIIEALKMMKGRHVVLKGNHDKSVKWLEDCGVDIVLSGHGQRINLCDAEYPVSLVCVAEDADPRALVSEGIAISHEPYPNIKWPYLYGHTHNNPVPWDYMDKPYPISAMQGRNISIELVNYMPVPIPFLINDEAWIKKNYKYWYKRLFNYEGKRKRRDVRKSV